MENNGIRILIQRLTTNWNVARVIRVLIPLLIVIAAFKNGEWLFVGIASVMLVAALVGPGACSTGYSMPYKPGEEVQTKDIDYEEIKND